MQSLSVYRCRECDYGSHSYAELSYHMRTHNENNGCGFCDYRSSSQLDRDNHMQHHAAILPYRCSRCPYLSNTLVMLDEHTRLVHQTTYSLHCDSCGYQTNLRQEVMAEHQAMHSSVGSKLRPVTSRKPSVKMLESYSMKTKKVTGCHKNSKKSPRVLPKIEPAEGVVSEPSMTSNHIELCGNGFVAGSGNKMVQGAEQFADRRPWWDTETQLYPPLSTGVITQTDQEHKFQCASCGSWYSSAHQCNVIKTKRSASIQQCALCDSSISGKKSLADHYKKVHSRTWKALVLRISRSYPSLDFLCDSLESLVPEKYKETADSIWVTHKGGESVALDAPLSAVSLFRCTKCFKSFSSLDLQAGHKLLDQCRSLQLPLQFGCAVCRVDLGTPEKGLVHHIKHHSTLKAAQSGNSSKEDSYALMMEVLQRLSGEDQEVSQSSVINPKILDGGFEISCQLCSFFTTDMENFKRHLASTHWGSQEALGQTTAADATFSILYGCNFCDYICENATKFSSHVIEHAEKGKQNTGLEIQTKDEITSQNGEKEQLDEQSSPVSLSVEGELTTGNPKVHNAYSGTKIKAPASRQSKIKINCELCSFNTVHPSTLTIHMRSHTGYRPFVCSMCGKAFTTNSELRKHERRHAGLIERKYVCTTCGKAYSNSQHLKVHTRLHTGDRPFKCDLCSFAATSKSVLINHTATHTGEKNFKCHICDFTCASSGTLSNHRRLKHNIANKRKTLAETTPESILVAAKVAGKSKRFKPNTNASSDIVGNRTDSETIDTDGEASILVAPISTQNESEGVGTELPTQEKIIEFITIHDEDAMPKVAKEGSDVKTNKDIETGDDLQPHLDEHLPIYHIIQTGSSDYQMVEDVQSAPSDSSVN
ncbi:zinc finger protein 569-like [Watersipora subatra]|uniref:zinc finger protein 569-like n=1 Tax=Watersipora subatra TaxID=2589382 RepID=UPI00355B22D7